MIQYTTISIRPETKARLDEMGKKNESYDSLVNRLVECKNSFNDVRITAELLKKAILESTQKVETRTIKPQESS